MSVRDLDDALRDGATLDELAAGAEPMGEPTERADIEREIQRLDAVLEETADPGDYDRLVAQRDRLQECLCALEETADPETPTIHIREGQLPQIVDAAEEALAHHSRELYHRGGELVCVQVDEQTGLALLRGVKRHQLRMLLAESARWRKTRFDPKQGYVEYDANPSMDIVDAVRERTNWTHLQPCIGVVEAPTLRADFSVLNEPGYDPASMLLFRPGDTCWPRIAERPTRAEAEAALAILLDLVREFPFRDPMDRSVALALLITSIVRPALPTAPLFVVTGHTRGTGKSYLCQIAHVLATGHDWDPKTATDDNELRKALMASALQGERFFIIDNLNRKLASPVLDAALTSPYFSDRILGASRVEKVRLAFTMLATGNNLAIGGDLGRRTVRCYLHTSMEHPEERRFERDTLGMARRLRPQIVHAALTIVRACLAEDPRVERRPMGSFEAWDKVVRRPLLWLGQPDPLDTQVALRDDAEVEVDAWASLLLAWRGLYGPYGRSVKQVLKAIQDPDDDKPEAAIQTALDLLCDGRPSTRRVGALFASYRDRVVAGLRLEHAGKGTAGAYWRVGIQDPDAVRRAQERAAKIQEQHAAERAAMAPAPTSPRSNDWRMFD